MAARGSQFRSMTVTAPYEMWGGMGQDVVAMREVGGEWGSVPGSPPRIPMGKDTRDTRGHPPPPPPTSIVSPKTESVCSSFQGGCFSMLLSGQHILSTGLGDLEA